MRTSLPILALAVYATSALAWVADIFTCIDPEAHCCTILATSGIGVDCFAAPLRKLSQFIDNTTKNEPYPSEEDPEYVSACYRYSVSTDQAQIPACCNPDYNATTPNMKTFDCMPPEKYLFVYSSEYDEGAVKGYYGKQIPGHYDDDGNLYE